MTVTPKDAASTVVAALVALVYAANTLDWGVPLLGSNRWAAGAIFLLGFATCTLAGRAAEERPTVATVLLGALGVGALALAVVALATAAQWALGLLALDTVVLWAGSTLRHAATPLRRPLHPV